jgi:hypothetical protein
MHTEQTRRMMSEIQDSSQTKREEITDNGIKFQKLSAQKISNYFFAPLHVYNSTVIVFSLV